MLLDRLRDRLAIRRFGKVIERVAFLVQTREIVNHYAPVWDRFGGVAFDVLLHGSTTLTHANLSPAWGCRVARTDELLSAHRKYRCVVSNHIVGLSGEDGRTPLIHKLGIENIRFMYAAGKSGWNLSDWNRHYDGILCYGPYHAKAFAEIVSVPVRQMGYPRFDRFFTERPDMAALRARFGCSADRKTVVWLPTWKSLSSVGHFDREISDLTARYNVVVKVHPLMAVQEPARVAALRRLHLNAVVDTPEDNLPLYQLADYMLFDYGGPPFAGIYTAKRFVLLNVPAAAEDPLTGANSPDVLLREDFVGVDPGEQRIAAVLEDEAHWECHAAAADRWRELYFAPYAGNSAQIAADAILNRSWLRQR